MKNILLLFVLFLLATTASSQNNFNTIISDGDKAMKAGNFLDALKKYDAAEALDPSKKEKIKDKRTELFNKIELLRKDALKAKEDTRKLLVEVQAQKKIADSALAQAEKFIDALDLDEGKLALAYKNGKIGYINQVGDLVIPYRYETAGAFDNTGFAKVQTIEEFAIPNTLGVKTEFRPVDYLIDQSDKQYKVAYRLEDIKTEEEIIDTIKIKALDLRNIRLNGFPPQILEHTQLAILILDPGLKKENNFNTIPKEIQTIGGLEFLSLRKCKIDSLPAEIGGLKNLQTLDLRENNLRSLPPEITQLKELRTLNIKENNLEALPENIGQLKNLEILLVTDNPVKSIPAGLFELPSLKILDLRKSSLKSWPNGLGKIVSLQHLNFADNSLKTFPAEILQLTKLETLDLSFNQLKILPATIKRLTQLRSLNLRANELNELVAGIESLKNLQVLDLSGNNLASFPSQILQLKNLESLDLSFNKSLKTIPPQISQLKQLNVLKLNNTAIPDSEKQKIQGLIPWCNIIFQQ